MYYRVIRPFNYRRANGQKEHAEPGQHVDIVLKSDSESLLASGKIAPIDLPPVIRGKSVDCAAPLQRTVRVGLFLYTSTHYSGGRIHLFQYAHCMQRLGAEVYYVSNVRPTWARDYPEVGIKYLIWGVDAPPDDLDILMTDGKGMAGGYASAYQTKHPSARLVVMNFETPNWVREFCPTIADKIASGHKSTMEIANALVANSAESARYLLKWIKQEDRRCDVLAPAVNTYAAAKADAKGRLSQLKRPYAVWSARGQTYKGADAAARAVWKLDKPFDLVAFGQSTSSPAATKYHQLYALGGSSDVIKLAAMRDAHVTLAPSLFEGFGMVPAESLAMGTPVVAYDLPVLRAEYAGVPGLHLVEHGNASAFVKKAHELINAPKPKLDVKPVRKRFGLDAMCDSVQKLPWHAMSKPRVTCQMISYWGFIPESLESVYDDVDEILIAFGPDRKAQRIDDGSLQRIRAFPDPDKKIRVEVRKQWNDKRDMRQWCHAHSTGNYNLVLDGDEIWVGFAEWKAKGIAFGSPRWVTLWHDAEHYVVDGPGFGPRWGKEIEPFGCICSHYRWSWLRRSYRWGVHCRLEDVKRTAVRRAGSAAARAVPSCVIYHLGHVLHPEVMRAKHKFYQTRDGNDPVRQKREVAWHEWDGSLGDCGDGTIKAIAWALPDIVRRGVESAKAIKL